MDKFTWLFIEDAKRELWNCNSREELAHVIEEFQLTNPNLALDLDEDGWKFSTKKDKEQIEQKVKDNIVIVQDNKLIPLSDKLDDLSQPLPNGSIIGIKGENYHFIDYDIINLYLLSLDINNPTSEPIEDVLYVHTGNMIAQQQDITLRDALVDVIGILSDIKNEIPPVEIGVDLWNEVIDNVEELIDDVDYLSNLEDEEIELIDNERE